MSVVRRHGSGERWRRANVALEQRGEVLELLIGEAAPGPSGVDELAVLVGAEVERAESRARAFGTCEPDDHEFVGAVGADLEPVGRTAGAVRRVRLLRDDPFETELHDLFVQRFPVLLEVLDVLDRADTGHDPLEECLALLEGQRPHVVPLERQQVEDVEYARRLDRRAPHVEGSTHARAVL